MNRSGARRGDLWRLAAGRLRAAGVATPELDARLLVAAALDIAAQAIVLHPDTPVSAAEAEAAEALVRRRLAGEPVDRILGRREFWGMSLSIGPATLSPRSDTETLVEAALDAVPDRAAALRILDLGTGSGAVLAALLSERPNAFGVGVDRSADAARIARDNLLSHGAAGRAGILVGDWDAALAGRFDLVVSNPPYIATADLAGLAVEVREHDPALALDGGPDGLAAYRAVLDAVARRLAPGGVAVVELGAGQEGAVAALAAARDLSVDGPARRDLAGVPRALVMRRT